MLILLTGFKPLSTPMLTRKELLLQHTNRNDIIMRKLKITELNRISIEEFKEARSEERRVGKECASMCRSRWSPYH